MINIYTKEITPRVRYSFQIVFESILNNTVDFFEDANKFNQAQGIKINYSTDEQIEGFRIAPHKLLFQNHLQEYYPDVFTWEGTTVFFRIEKSFLPFDLFAATFFLITRQEEYYSSARDEHRRFQARKSFAAINNVLEKPLVNIWTLKLANLIEKETGQKIFTRPTFKYIPTFDIDNAYAFKHKGFSRNFLSCLRDIKSRRWTVVKKRIAVSFRGEQDPYDTYDFIIETLNKYGYKPITFFLLNKKGRHNRSLSPNNPAYKTLINKMAKAGDVGIHPSYSTIENTTLLTTEIKKLNTIIGQKVEKSRQHYLRLKFPKTYQNLISQGITSDYTLGYPTRPGFRANICTPYPFFNILTNEKTDLIIYPFQIMDVTLRYYRNFNAEEALRKIKKLIEETYAVGGTFISLWHNESLSNKNHWAGWKNVFTEMVKMASEKENEYRHTNPPKQ